MPPVSPQTAGTGTRSTTTRSCSSPQGYGYGLGATVTVGAAGRRPPRSAAKHSGGCDRVRGSVPQGSTLRLQQLLATLGYLPLSFHYAGARGARPQHRQEAAAIKPPAGSFSWRYPNTPAGS